MDLFFTLFGAIFICSFVTGTYYIYEAFSMNRITNLLHPLNRGTWCKINHAVLPILIWGTIELPILGTHQNFIISILLSVFLTCATMYIFIIGESILFKKETKIVQLASRYLGVILSQIICYLLFTIPATKEVSIFLSIGTIVLLTIIYVVTVLYPPKTSFFNGPK